MIGFVSVTEKLPTWNDGLLILKHRNGKEYTGRFNELGLWFRVDCEKNGILRYDLESEIITHWKKHE